MGSPLGPLFANYYMAYLENSILSDPTIKPNLYARYVDDIFIQIQSVDHLEQLRQKFQDNSVLKFTFEIGISNKLPFLDVMIDSSNNNFQTTVYHKPTDQGHCLNALSECSHKYKDSVISNYLNRAYRISQNWSDFHNEVQHIKQILINNNYSNSIVDSKIQSFLNKIHTEDTKDSVKSQIPIFYNSQYHPNYKTEERVIKEIIDSNVICSNPYDKLNVIFYYKNKKSCNLVMRNNLSPPPPTAQKTGVVYKFTCPFPHREAEDYIGLTTTTLNTRMVRHVQAGSIKRHLEDVHNTKPNKAQLLDNTTILTHCNIRQKLYIKEALLIQQCNPKINKQYNNFSNILKLYKSRNPNQSTNHHTIPPQSIPLTSHHVSPQINHRIEQLISNSRNSEQTSPIIQHTPVSRRLRSSVRLDITE